MSSNWNAMYPAVEKTPAMAEGAAVELIRQQPDATALTLAIARCDAEELYPPFRRFLEHVTRASQGRVGYPAVSTIPHVQGGFLYMAAAVSALRFESWNVFGRLLTQKFEWYYQADRPLYSYGFAHRYFFHPEALGRDASKAHDLYRELLSQDDALHILTLSKEEFLDVYLQTQLLMSLRGAQLLEKGEDTLLWPDFGRFYEHRVVRVIDRVHSNDEFAAGVLSAFEESRESFFDNLNKRLRLIRGHFRGGRYFWESITSWEPR